ncbi:MAG: hypothetical protein NTW06_02625 [Candidatus Falkowbacteria bacterium]|nr:hypothetical protein [Candidatus Falkowbacteria bacterium]
MEKKNGKILFIVFCLILVSLIAVSLFIVKNGDNVNGHRIKVIKVEQSAVQLFGSFGIPNYHGEKKYEEIKIYHLIVKNVANGVADKYKTARLSDIALTKNVGEGLQNLHILTNDKEAAKSALRKINFNLFRAAPYLLVRHVYCFRDSGNLGSCFKAC